MNRRYASLLPVVILSLLSACQLAAQAPKGKPAEPNLSAEQMADFLLHANVTASRRSSIGITSPWWLTLSDGTVTHEASFQSIDERKSSMQLADGRTELNFVDSYKYNIGGYELAKLLGLGDAIPVTVERKWNQQVGSLSWRVPIQMDELTRGQRKLVPPDTDAWNKQMYNMRVFDQLIYDTDANLTNFLVGDDWHLWRVDFSRAFRKFPALQSEKDLPKCGRALLEKLKTLDRKEVLARTKSYLTNGEVDALMSRRDKLVAHFQQLIAQQGEQAILF
jgi:hypothetical protein